jgi:hypothetical protein
MKKEYHIAFSSVKRARNAFSPHKRKRLRRSLAAKLRFVENSKQI